MTTARICPECGGSYGSRYHEVAHDGGEDRNYSAEDLEATAAILRRYEAELEQSNND